MYAQHQPLISGWSRSHPEHFALCGLLCILSARQPFDRLGDDMEAVLSGNDPSPLFAWKAEAWRQHEAAAAPRLQALEMAHFWHKGSPLSLDTRLLELVASWHGFGFVKGGFLLQLTFGRLGCLDVRNAQDFGLGRIRNPDRRSPTALSAQARRYAKRCRALGGPDYLWDHWCTNYALSSARLTTPWQVSAEHCRVLGLDPGADPADIPF